MPHLINDLDAVNLWCNGNGRPACLSAQQGISGAIADTLDARALTCEFSVTLAEVQCWFGDAALIDVDIRLGGNGVVGNEMKPF